MEFRIADTFTDSLSRLNGNEQKAVKTTAFDLQMNPANPGLSLHRLEKVKDDRFWSARVNSDIRIIIHRSDNDMLLCYVDHHDKAYQWAERRKLEVHPKTGAAQMVEIRETVKEIVVPVVVQEEVTKKPLFAGKSDEELLALGLPEEWLEDVKHVTEDSILDIVEHLPAEAAEALLDMATGGTPVTTSQVQVNNPFDHPHASRRFRLMNNSEELARALDYPWDKWIIFLHPDQRHLVEKHHDGPIRISGSAGTGKTVVALHRAVSMAEENDESRVLLTTYSDPLAHVLKNNLTKLLSAKPRLAERIDVMSLGEMGLRLYQGHIGKPDIITDSKLREIIATASEQTPDHSFTQHFLYEEWTQVVDPWQIKDWETYKDFIRLGRKTRLPESKRQVVWDIFTKVDEALGSEGLITFHGMFTDLAEKLGSSDKPIYDYIIIDECQDINVSQMKLLSALGKHQKDSLTFTGDIGQRIFQQPFSWKQLGVEIRGRSFTLKVNYRTSHQIRLHADKLLETSLTDIDGITEEREGTVSVFNGPNPLIQAYSTIEEEVTAVNEWILQELKNGTKHNEIAIFVRSDEQLHRAQESLDASSIPYKILDEQVNISLGKVSVCTMHLTKGLEFKSVVIMACDDEVIPLQARIESIGDEADLEEVYNTERQLLYVACTRARENLMITGLDPLSEFIDDMMVS